MPATAPQPDHRTTYDRIVSGDHRAALEALRDKLAVAMEAAPPYAVAPLAARLQAVLSDLADLSTDAEPNPLDLLAARRRARRGEEGDE